LASFLDISFFLAADIFDSRVRWLLLVWRASEPGGVGSSVSIYETAKFCVAYDSTSSKEEPVVAALVAGSSSFFSSGFSSFLSSFFSSSFSFSYSFYFGLDFGFITIEMAFLVTFLVVFLTSAVTLAA